MYTGSETVALPPKANRILQRSGGRTYVCYFTRRWWDPKRGRTVDNRMCVGRLSDDGGTMLPNARWLEIRGETPAHEAAKYRNVGVWLGLRAAAEKVGLLGAMREHLPDQCDRLFALVTYVVDDGCATAQRFPAWCYHNWCGLEHPMSDTTISETYRAVAKDDWGRDDLMADFRRAYMEAVPHGDGPVAVALDGTNRLCRARGNSYREHGLSKCGKKGVPQIGTALIVDELSGVPLYTEDFYGSLLDMTETPATVGRVPALGFEKMLFAVDSGYATADCARAFTEAGFEFTVMTPESYVVFKGAMASHSEEVRKEAHYIASHDCYGLGIEGVSCLGGTYDAHLFFDASRAKEEIDSIHQKAQALLDLANERVRHADKFRDKFAPHVVVTRAPKDPETGKTYHAELDHEVIQAEIDSAGYFLVVSSPGHASEEVLGTQRLRDRAERELERHDSFFGMLASGTRGTRAYVGKTFMGFLALVTCESFRWLTRDAMGGSDTCATLLDELRKLQCFRDSDGKGSLATGMTKRQKEIFACLGMSEGDVREAVAELSL